MCIIKNKILLMHIVATFFATNINTLKVKMVELSAGDIINLNYLNPEATETFGDIFNSNNTKRFVEDKISPGAKLFNFLLQACIPFKDLKSYYYPRLKVDNKIIELPNIYNNTNRENVFDINPKYINGNYSYGIATVCRFLKKESVISEVINKNDFPIVSKRINYKLLLDRTAVLRFKQENQTHYVLSIGTGECLQQAFINRAEFCHQTHRLKVSARNFIKSSEDKSRVIITSGDPDRAKHINDYLNMYNMSLLQLTKLTARKTFYNIFEPIPVPGVLELNLRSLPDLPKVQLSPSIAHEEFVSDIVPGDVVSLEDLKRLDALIKTDNILVDVPDQKTSPFTYFNYTHCRPFSPNDSTQIEFVPYKLHLNYETESFYKFDIFEEMVKQKNYGVDPKYLTHKFKCLKVKICSEFVRRKLIISSVEVVNLDKNVHKFRIFENQNVVLRYALENETHYVTRTETGNCVFQALIYENADGFINAQQIPSPLLFIGKILSANNDHALENWTEELVKNTATGKYKTLMSSINNPTVTNLMFSKLSGTYYSNTLMNIYLDKLK